MKKPRKRTTLREDMGKFLLDFGKLVCCPVTPDSLPVMFLEVSCDLRYRRMHC